jgi:hypothetical protein
MATVADIKLLVLHHIREKSDGNSVIDDADNFDYVLSIPPLIDAAQKEMAVTYQVAEIHREYKIVNKKVDTLTDTEFLLKQHLDEDITVEAEGGLSYYFEVSKIATVYIEEETSPDTWSTLTTINHSATDGSGFTAYKADVTSAKADADNSIRIRFSGSYPYEFRNAAIYGYSFPTDDDVPIFSRFISHDLPSTLYKFHHVKRQHDRKELALTYDYKLDYTSTTKKVLLDRDLSGEYIIKYSKYPDDITYSESDPEASDTETIELPTEAIIPLVYRVCQKLLEEEDDRLSLKFRDLFNESSQNIEIPNGIGRERITDINGWL